MRYDVEPQGMDGYGLIAAIAAKRGCALLQDYRSGLLGCISLETSQSRALMLQGESAGPSRASGHPTTRRR
jgi:hypothetical protein